MSFLDAALTHIKTEMSQGKKGKALTFIEYTEQICPLSETLVLEMLTDIAHKSSSKPKQ